MKLEKKSKCEDEFYVRFPYNSINFYNQNLSIEKNTIKLAKTEFLHNLIASSPELVDVLLDGTYDEVKMNQTITKYLIRSATRTTPFGLLSGVAKGAFHDIPCTMITDMRKKVRVDMEWYYNICKKVEEESGMHIKLKLNESIFIHPERVYNHYSSYFNKTDHGKLDIMNTRPFKILQNTFTKNGFKTKDELHREIKKHYDDVEDTVISSFLETLIDKEYLISIYRTSLSEGDPLSALIKQMEHDQKLITFVDDLKDIQMMLTAYSAELIENDESLYTILIDKMKSIASSKYYLMYDLYSDSCVHLPTYLKDDIEEYMSFITSFDNLQKKYDTYYTKFLNKYGTTSVCYTDMIDPVRGIDYPEVYDENIRTDNYTILENYLKRNENENAICLDQLVIEHDKHKHVYLQDAEIAFYVIKNHDETYTFVTSPLGGSNFAWRSFGRFSYLYDDEKTQVKKNTVEVEFLPKDARVANILLCKSKAEYVCDFNLNGITHKKIIKLSDIYVTAIDGKLIFTDQKQENILDFISTNMCNMSLFPNELKTLITLTETKYYDIFSIHKKLEIFYKNKLHRPEIRYKNFIISSEKWFLNKNMFGLKNDFEKEFINIQHDFHIPILVYVGYGDNQLLLHLYNHEHLQIIKDMIYQKDAITLTRCYFTEENLILCNHLQGKLIAEFVFQYQKENLEFDVLKRPRYQSTIMANHELSPLEKCVYFNYETKSSLIDYILIHKISPFVQELINDKLISHFFFIRYRDHDVDTIRLRLFYNDSISEVLAKCQSFNFDLLHRNFIFNISINMYEREIFRYGGEKNIAFFEMYFYVDSLMAIEVIKSIRNKMMKITKEDMFVLSCLYTLQNIVLSLQDIEILFSKFKLHRNNKKELKVFKMKNSKYIQQIFEGVNISANIFPYMALSKAYDILLQERVTNGDLEKKALYDILLSIFHMRFNRIIGIQRDEENKYMTFIENIMYSNTMRKKYEKK